MSTQLRCCDLRGPAVADSLWPRWTRLQTRPYGLNDYPLFWAGVIAAAQLLDAIKHVFPLAREHKSASKLTVALEILFIDTQYEWEKIYAGRLSELDIMEARRKMQKLKLEAERNHFPDGFQPPSKLVALAAEEARTYMMLTYVEGSLDSV